jgi:hypothetical protein
MSRMKDCRPGTVAGARAPATVLLETRRRGWRGTPGATPARGSLAPTSYPARPWLALKCARARL